MTTRRTVATLAALAALPWGRARAQAPAEAHARFAAEAARMRDQAVAAGDQPYGAVLVFEGAIAGLGASRVIADNNPDAHAERVALRAAQRALARVDLTGATIYATSIPCAICQRALAAAGVSAMRVGPQAEDRGPPKAGL